MHLGHFIIGTCLIGGRLLGQSGLHLGNLGAAGVNGSHYVLDGIRRLALILGGKPLADGAEILIQLPLLRSDGQRQLGGFLDILGLVGSHLGYVFGFFCGDIGIQLGFFGKVFKK